MPPERTSTYPACPFSARSRCNTFSAMMLRLVFA